MLKNILDIEGAQVLSNKEKKSIRGGGRIAMICAPEPPICSESDYDCEQLYEYHLRFCVNG